MADIKNLNPVEIWRNFDKLTQVPRPSGHLEKIQAYLLDWAKEAGVEAFQDPAGNIVMMSRIIPYSVSKSFLKHKREILSMNQNCST